MRKFPPNWPYPMKRRESGITKVCLDYLRILENSKQIAWYQRMNSGHIKSQSDTGHSYFVTLCRPGTADIYVRLNNGHTVWIENKIPGEDITNIQKEFKKRMERIGDSYIMVRSIQELRELMQERIR